MIGLDFPNMYVRTAVDMHKAVYSSFVLIAHLYYMFLMGNFDLGNKLIMCYSKNKGCHILLMASIWYKLILQEPV